MEVRALNVGPSVLIVDSSEETCEVLRSALSRRGVRTIAASGLRQSADLARKHQPDLIVLDLDAQRGVAAGGSDPADFARQCGRSIGRESTPLVILGTLRRPSSTMLPGEFVPKPYHYGPLIRKIEELLAASSAA